MNAQEARREAAAQAARLRDAARDRGRELDDRFRGAVDPIGQKIEDDFRLRPGMLKTAMRTLGWGGVLAIVLAVIVVVMILLRVL